MTIFSSCQQLSSNNFSTKSTQILDLLTYCNDLTYAQRRVLDVMLYMQQRYVQLSVTQRYIARKAGISLSHCQRVLKHFERDGIIASTYRFLERSLYRVSDAFFVYETRGHLSKIFKALSYIPSMFLFQPDINPWFKQTPIANESKSGQINYINNKYIYINNSIHQRVCARGGAGSLKNKKRTYWRWGRRTMSVPMEQRAAILAQCKKGDPLSVPQRPVFASFSRLKITPWGQIRLSLFDDATLRYGLSALAKRSDVQNHYKWLVKVCLEYCRENNLRPDIEWYNQLTTAIDLPENVPFIEQNLPKLPKHQLWVAPEKVIETDEQKKASVEKFYEDPAKLKAQMWLKANGFTLEQFVFRE